MKYSIYLMRYAMAAKNRRNRPLSSNLKRLTIKDTGKHDGSEIVQLYVGPTNATKVQRPLKELKGFARVALKSGEEKEVRMELDERAFAWFDVSRHAWTIDVGSYTLLCGASSQDIRQQACVEIEAGAIAV